MEGIARAEAMFELTRDWVRQRKAFGRRVADLQTVNLFLNSRSCLPPGSAQTGRAQDSFVCVSSFRRLLPLLAQQLQAGQRDVEHGQVLGHRLAEQGGRRLPSAAWRSLPSNLSLIEACLHSGWGFMWETQIAKCYANSRVSTIYAGTNEIMKELIARNITRDK